MAAPTYTLTLTAEGVRAAVGQIMVQLLKADDTTGTAPPLSGVRAPAIAGVTALSFTGLEAGAGPLARIWLDQPLPLGFHGQFVHGA